MSTTKRKRRKYVCACVCITYIHTYIQQIKIVFIKSPMTIGIFILNIKYVHGIQQLLHLNQYFFMNKFD